MRRRESGAVCVCVAVWAAGVEWRREGGERERRKERGKDGGGIFPSLLLSRFSGGAAKATLCDDETKSAAMRRRETKERRDCLRACAGRLSLSCACGLRCCVGLGTLCAACLVAARRRMKNEEEGRRNAVRSRCDVSWVFFFRPPIS